MQFLLIKCKYPFRIKSKNIKDPHFETKNMIGDINTRKRLDAIGLN